MKRHSSLFLATAIGSFATLILTRQGLDAVSASALATLAIYVLILGFQKNKSLAPGVFCGAFTGMSNLDFVTDTPFLWLTHALLLSAVTGILYTAIDRFSLTNSKWAFNGFGGKLGTTAFISSLPVLSITYFLTGEPIIIRESFENTLSTSQAIEIIILSSLGATATFALSHIKIQNSRVVFSALLGLAGVILFPSNMILAIALYTGTFVGMSAPNIIPKTSQIAIAGILTGIVFIIYNQIFSGVGGTLGFSAFTGILLYVAIKKLLPPKRPAFAK